MARRLALDEGVDLYLDHLKVEKANLVGLSLGGRIAFDFALTYPQRVQRLIDSNVMQVVAVTDPLELGFARQAMIGIRAHGELEPIADALSEMEEVDYVVITAGSFDLLAEVVCESDEHLLEVLSHRIRKIENVVSTETFMYLKLRKQTYSWGVR